MPLSIPPTTAGNHCVTVATGNGHGSAATKVRRFTTVVTNVGAAVTYADSAVAGASFTINQTGFYEVHYRDDYSAAASVFGVSINSAQLSTNLSAHAAANVVGMALNSSGARFDTLTRVVLLNAGDVIRPHTDGAMDAGPVAFFSIRKVSNP